MDTEPLPEGIIINKLSIILGEPYSLLGFP